MRKLLWCEIEGVVCVQTQGKTERDDDGERYKTDAIGHGREKRNEKDPECRIVHHPNQCQWVS